MSEALAKEPFFIKRETTTQTDGAVWETVRFPNGFVTLTSSGRELVDSDPNFWSDLRRYRQAARQSTIGDLALNGSVPAPRSYVGEGTRAMVFTLGRDCVVKETYPNHPPLFRVMKHMDGLQDTIQKHVPRWIDMPKHYGYLHINGRRGPDSEYLLMQRIDAGITMRDIFEPENSTEEAQTRVAAELGVLTDVDKQELLERYATAKQLIDKALKRDKRDPNEYLDDYHRKNVLVERLATPIAGSRFKLWIIDQHLPERFREELAEPLSIHA